MTQRRGFRVVAALAALSWLSWLAVGVAIAQGARVYWWEALIWGGWWSAASLRRSGRRCSTARAGTGSRCTCDYACDNYWIRARADGC